MLVCRLWNIVRCLLRQMQEWQQQILPLLPAAPRLPDINLPRCWIAKAAIKKTEYPWVLSFVRVAEKYAGDKRATDMLSQKIVKGGSGVWGDVAMAAHPSLQQSDLKQIIQYILSLKPEENTKPKAKSLKPKA